MRFSRRQQEPKLRLEYRSGPYFTNIGLDLHKSQRERGCLMAETYSEPCIVLNRQGYENPLFGGPGRSSGAFVASANLSRSNKPFTAASPPDPGANFQNKSVNGPTPMSWSTVFGVTYYGYFSMRFKNEAISDVRQKPKRNRSSDSPVNPASS